MNRVQMGAPDWSRAQLDTSAWLPQNRQVPLGARPSASLATIGADIAALAISGACALLVSQFIMYPDRVLTGALSTALSVDSALLLAFIAATAVLAVFASSNHYSRRVPFWTELRCLAVTSAVALLFSGCAAFFLHQQSIRSFPLTVWTTFPVFAVIARTIVRRRLAAMGRWQVRTVIVGAPASASETLAALQTERQLGYDVVAVVDPEKLDALPSSRRWSLMAQHHRADLIILSYTGSAGPGRDTIESLLHARVPFALMPQLEGLPVLGFEQTRFFSHDTVMYTFRNNLARPVARLTKIVFDLIATTAGVVVLLPVLAVVAALVKLDGGPALFGHTRIGRGGRPFRCLKFRSMAVDSDTMLRDLLAQDPDAAAEWLQTRKLRNDPRITRIGRVLRATSLDELPQLFNVLRLEMSLVGPRPIVSAEVERYGGDIAYYYETRPGLTGLWQVSGRTETSYTKRVQLDTWYAKNWTLWHDVAILARTIPAVLQRRGAV